MDRRRLDGIDTIVMMEFEPADAFLDIFEDPCTGEDILIVLGTPSEVAGGLVFLRLSNIERAVETFRAISENRTTIQSNSIALREPSEVTYCTVCHQSITPSKEALRLSRLAKPSHRDAMLTVAHNTVSEHVWCHRSCLSRLAAVLENVWNDTDQIIGDAL